MVLLTSLFYIFHVCSIWLYLVDSFPLFTSLNSCEKCFVLLTDPDPGIQDLEKTRIRMWISILIIEFGASEKSDPVFLEGLIISQFFFVGWERVRIRLSFAQSRNSVWHGGGMKQGWSEMACQPNLGNGELWKNAVS